jgi:hypothetical protein
VFKINSNLIYFFISIFFIFYVFFKILKIYFIYLFVKKRDYLLLRRFYVVLNNPYEKYLINYKINYKLQTTNYKLQTTNYLFFSIYYYYSTIWFFTSNRRLCFFLWCWSISIINWGWDFISIIVIFS